MKKNLILSVTLLIAVAVVALFFGCKKSITESDNVTVPVMKKLIKKTAINATNDDIAVYQEIVQNIVPCIRDTSYLNKCTLGRPINEEVPASYDEYDIGDDTMTYAEVTATNNSFQVTLQNQTFLTGAVHLTGQSEVYQNGVKVMAMSETFYDNKLVGKMTIGNDNYTIEVSSTASEEQLTTAVPNIIVKKGFVIVFQGTLTDYINSAPAPAQNTIINNDVTVVMANLQNVITNGTSGTRASKSTKDTWLSCACGIAASFISFGAGLIYAVADAYITTHQPKDQPNPQAFYYEKPTKDVFVLKLSTRIEG